MLRISHSERAGAPVLVLEGKLLEPWLEELRAALAPRRGKSPVKIDLSAVTFADPAGALLLATLARGGVELDRPSPLIRALIAAAID